MVGPPTVGYNVCMSFEEDESLEIGDQQPHHAEDQFDEDLMRDLELNNPCSHTSNPDILPHLRPHIPYVVPTCGGSFPIPQQFQQIPHTQPVGLTARLQ